jgi:hypothetical protein
MINDLLAACAELKRQLEAVLAPDYLVENPVTNARGRIKLQEGVGLGALRTEHG